MNKGRAKQSLLERSGFPSSQRRGGASRPPLRGGECVLLILAVTLLMALGAAFVYGQRFRGFFFQNEPPLTELVVARWKYTAWGKFGGTGWSHNYPSSDQHFAKVVRSEERRVGKECRRL